MPLIQRGGRSPISTRGYLPPFSQLTFSQQTSPIPLQRPERTPLILAAKAGRLDVVQMLIKAGAKQPAKDIFHRSALFYASRSGNVGAVSLLLQGKPSKNDGSLHEAARCFHPEVIRLLLDAGHDIDYRSTKHGGRTALGEMALRGRVPDDIATAEEAAELLKEEGANPWCKCMGKPSYSSHWTTRIPSQSRSCSWRKSSGNL